MPVTIYIRRSDGTEKITLNTEVDLGIDDDNIEGELSRMGQILGEYGIHFAELKAQLAQDETHETKIKAYYDIWYRDPVNYSGKFTEPKIKCLVICHPKVLEALDRTNQTRISLFKAENLYRSLYQKSDCLRALAYKHRVEIKATGI